jgi:hypothetical protein
MMRRVRTDQDLDSRAILLWRIRDRLLMSMDTGMLGYVPPPLYDLFFTRSKYRLIASQGIPPRLESLPSLQRWERGIYCINNLGWAWWYAACCMTGVVQLTRIPRESRVKIFWTAWPWTTEPRWLVVTKASCLLWSFIRGRKGWPPDGVISQIWCW